MPSRVEELRQNQITQHEDPAIGKLNHKIDTAMAPFFGAIFAFFDKAVWLKALFTTPLHYVLFPIAALANFVQWVLSVIDLATAKNKNAGKVGSFLSMTLKAGIIVTAVIGGIVAAAVFASVAPILFFGAMVYETVANLVKGFYAIHKLRMYAKNETRLKEELGELQFEENRNRYRQLRNQSFIGAAFSAVLSLAVGFTMVFYKVLAVPFAIAGSVTGGVLLGLGIAKGVGQYIEEKKAKKELRIPTVTIEKDFELFKKDNGYKYTPTFSDKFHSLFGKNPAQQQDGTYKYTSYKIDDNYYARKHRDTAVAKAIGVLTNYITTLRGLSEKNDNEIDADVRRKFNLTENAEINGQAAYKSSLEFYAHNPDQIKPMIESATVKVHDALKNYLLQEIDEKKQALLAQKGPLSKQQEDERQWWNPAARFRVAENIKRDNKINYLGQLAAIINNHETKNQLAEFDTLWDQLKNYDKALQSFGKDIGDVNDITLAAEIYFKWQEKRIVDLGENKTIEDLKNLDKEIRNRERPAPAPQPQAQQQQLAMNSAPAGSDQSQQNRKTLNLDEVFLGSENDSKPLKDKITTSSGEINPNTLYGNHQETTTSSRSSVESTSITQSKGGVGSQQTSISNDTNTSTLGY